jgi:hypothetical protein
MAGMKSRLFRLLTTALCVWLDIQVSAARRQREAVTAIVKAGGTVNYDYEFVPSAIPADVQRRLVHGRVTPGPVWLRNQIGDDYFRTVVRVCFNHPKATIRKADLDELVKLPHVKDFVLEGTGFHDEDLKALGELRQLEVLQLIDMRINGSILARLPNPERLKNLCLSKTNIDDAALRRVEEMTGLETLWLDGTRVTSAGLRHLRSLMNLKNLYLQNTQVSESGVTSLRAALPNTDIRWP